MKFFTAKHTIIKNRPAIYFQQGGQSTMANFCVFGCKVDNTKSTRNYIGRLSSMRTTNYDGGVKEDHGQTYIENLTTDLSGNDVDYNPSNIFVREPKYYNMIDGTTHYIKQIQFFFFYNSLNQKHVQLHP
ncbi:hypothetical protein M9Y10_006322 [Tritrichomonas musculus]|uniref:Uncharacterized protein n=1 Tax=Tritrichomonas musculus TaxID=1915356 RepID=A0ABR2JEG3_9EUKA